MATDTRILMRIDLLPLYIACILIFHYLILIHTHFCTGPLSLHTETAIYFAQQLSPAKFTITPVPASEKEFPEENTFYIECVGSGHTNAFL